MSEGQRRSTRIKPVPGVTWRSHMGCGALFGFVAGFLTALHELTPDGWGKPVLLGLGFAVVAGVLAAVLGNRFWLR